MSKTVDFSKLDAGLKALYYGVPGSGKTRLAYSAALDDRMHPVLGIDAFGNPESVRSYKRLPTVIRISEIKDMNDPYNWLASGQPLDHPFAEEFGFKHPFKTIVLDTLTDIQRYAFNEVMNIPDEPGHVPMKREWDHFNKVLGIMINMGKLFFELAETQKIHVIMTAHEKKKEDRMTGQDMYNVLLDGQSDNEVPGKAMMVGRMTHISRLGAREKKELRDAKEDVESSTVACFVKPSSSFVAKDQYGTGRDYFLDPTMTDILDAIESGGA